MLFLYLQVFLVLHAPVYELLRRRFLANREALHSDYAFVGMIDAMQCVAQYGGNLESCLAEFAHGAASIDAEDLYHPLLPKPVCNSLNLVPPGAILTAANMAGKSTLLRTIGVNVLTARCWGLAFARRFVTSPFVLHTLIQKSDSLANAESFYMMEVRRVKTFVDSISDDPDMPHLVLVDEFFSGTNSRERIGAAMAVLEHMAGSGALIVIAELTCARGTPTAMGDEGETSREEPEGPRSGSGERRAVRQTEPLQGPTSAGGGVTGDGVLNERPPGARPDPRAQPPHRLLVIVWQT